MRHRLLTFLLLLGATQLPAQTRAGLEGSWLGTLDVGAAKLRLALTVTRSNAGAYGAQLVSID